MLSWSETFCSAVKTTIGAVPRQYNEIRVDEINHDIYSKHTFAVNICNYKKNKGNGQSQQFPKIYCTSKEVFLSKGLEAAEEIQQSNSKTYERCRNYASMQDLDAKFRMAFFSAKFTINTTTPGGTHYDGPYGEAPPERGIFLRCANRKPKVATCEA